MLVPSARANPVTSNVFRRVVQIQFVHDHDGQPTAHSGTAFTLEADNSQYLVTASHILHGATGETVVHAVSDLGHRKISAVPIRPKGAVDVVALKLEKNLTVRFPLKPTTKGMVVSQQVYFLGFPFGLHTRDNKGFTVPFIKSGIISAMDYSDPSQWILYIDAHNNTGFSGGPIVFWHGQSNSFRVAGVVSGYRPGEQPVYREVHERDGTVSKTAVQGVFARENPGILIGHHIKHIVDAIESVNSKEKP